MAPDRIYVVDRIAEATVLLVDHNKQVIAVPIARFRARLAEGTVLRVPVDDAGTPNWFDATADAAEGDQRVRQARDMLKELKRRDKGGDVSV